MMEFGKSLKQAREAKGLSVAQLAETTHLAPTTVVELENEDFSHIAAPIYGRGFVKLYCETVGIDPKPYVNEFMEIFSGNHDTAIRERPVTPVESEEPSAETPVAPPAEPEALPAEPPAAPAKPVYTPGSLFESDPLFAPEPPPAPQPAPDPKPITAPTPPVRDPAIPRPQPPPADDHAFSRYAAPIRQWKPVIPTSAWRIGLLALGALVLLTALVLGIRALYRATSVTPDAPAEPAQESAAAQEAKPAQKAAPVQKAAVAEKLNDVKTGRTPQALPALYVD